MATASVTTEAFKPAVTSLGRTASKVSISQVITGSPLSSSESEVANFNTTISRLFLDSNASKLSIYEGYAMFLGLAVASFLIARGALAIRYRIYKDKDVMDATFDAGGKASAGTIATTIVAQWTWAATLLQSTSVTAKYGISGAFWYAAGATIQLFLFAMLTIQLKIRAPGAKTFLQVIYARYSRSTHITFCVFALMTNIIVTAMLMLGGAAALQSLVDGFNIELATLLFVATISVYTLMGGLGAAFYVSYFNTGSIMILIVVFLIKVFFDKSENSDNNLLGSIDIIYDLVKRGQGPSGNKESSYLTIVSYPGLMFGIINIVGNFGTVFVEQSYWQCGVAAKPVQGVVGFIAGGLTWFSVPYVFATTMGLAYLALGELHGSPLLNDEQVNQGLVAPIVGEAILGRSGQAMVAVMILMAVTSTGSAEVLAATSILVYDVYQIYLKPYRLVFDASTCILCGRERGRLANPRDKCVCTSMTYCQSCKTDDENIQSCKRAIKPDYNCLIHGPFRKYNDYLQRLANWCQVVVTLSIIPLTLILDALTLSLGWVYLFMGVLIGSAVIPISLCLFWTKLTGPAMTVGAIGGAVLGIISWLITSAYQPGGLTNFFESTGSEISMLVGNLVSILSSGIVVIIWSLIANRGTEDSGVEDSSSDTTWDLTRDIDNPLRPWTENYIREMNLTRFAALDQRPRLDDMEKKFRGAKLLAVIGSIVLTFGMLIIWPAATVTAGVMDLSTFTRWIHLAAVYGIGAAVFILVFPIVTEFYEIRRFMTERMSIEDATSATAPKAEHLSTHLHRISIASVAMTRPSSRPAEASAEESKWPVELCEDEAVGVDGDELGTGDDLRQNSPTMNSALSPLARRFGRKNRVSDQLQPMVERRSSIEPGECRRRDLESAAVVSNHSDDSVTGYHKTVGAENGDIVVDV